MPQITLSRLLFFGLIGSVVTVASVVLGVVEQPEADMHLEPFSGHKLVGENFSVQIVVEANVPVNVFKGDLYFDQTTLEVASIDYNTSIADLWAEEPWYSNGDGTLNFIGGTTKKGGFLGRDVLLTINFQTLKAGETNISMDNIRIMQHDGLGTDAPVTKPIDAVFSISEAVLEKETIVSKNLVGPTLLISPELPSTDLNNDGRQSAIDLSIFMTHLFSQNLRSDFNGDGAVNTKDLSIIIGQ